MLATRSRLSRSPTSSRASQSPALSGTSAQLVAIPASEVYAESGIPIISAAATDPFAYRSRSQNCLPNLRPRRSAGDRRRPPHHRSKLGTKIAIVNDKSTYRRGTCRRPEEIHQRQRRDRSRLRYRYPGRQRFLDLISKLKQANVDLVFMPAISRKAAFSSGRRENRD